MGFVKEIGKYVILMFETFKRPDKGRVFRRQLMIDFHALGVDSIGIVVFISLFTGGIIAMQMAYNIDNPLVPLYLVGYTTKQMMILEISPTIMSLILAGKVGSSIASEIGTMRVTEQIDALRVMGINPANYLILPKITAAVFFFPVLVIFSIAVGLGGGLLAVTVTGSVTPTDFIDGLQSWWAPFDITYAIIKTVVFAFIIASVSGYKGYTVQGGSVEVGRASTKAVVASSILIIIFDLVITQMLLT
ncbi:MAG: ABC transporter permease [Lentimicrobiaceae bacterium]|jgi:phospholipid/cholesterol/gamma-HCH transport system permease protein|nr:ABC transporter permease [Lentimicrobiaceae bacterium]MCP4909112.1 ABC transporter permease [Bacteroidota bacterium]MBT3454352.1 ABC transporter permease [Lentimicrobiaceae bacterium]MBT3817924.1 ABC transporter permease [Lentimicrobiaceae bacterium]MBT4061570.1 ABC transporter permease [Lentimicrobiaceae bacterium]